MSEAQINITFPDGSARAYPTGSTGSTIAESISSGLARQALAVKVDGEVWDLSRPLAQDSTVQILTWKDDEGKAAFWHSSAHLLAEALEALYPGVKFGIGPAIDRGFYYDVDLGGKTLGLDDLDAIEKKMVELAKQDNRYIRSEVSKEEALSFFGKKGDQYKLELIEELEDGTITFYRQGEFVDLCRGPHLPSTAPIKYPKLLNVAGAYWRGDEKRAQLTRIYGISFPKKKELDEFLELLELAKQRDHRKLGKELGLFMFSNKVGPGLPMWLPKGARLRETLAEFLRQEQVKRGYEPVVTPHIGKLDLYKTSGHYPYYQDSQFPAMFESDDQGYLLKPMNCPHHIEIFDSRPHSYRELPVRYAEFGTVYRYEQSGELGGLTRVRGFTQDDAHIFCTPEQVKDEFKNAIDLTLTVLHALDFAEFKAQVSMRDPDDTEKYVGDPEKWDAAEIAIGEAAREMGLDAIDAPGEAAFYGPKLDFMVRDALGREWQLGTVQLDYVLPERFDLHYIGEDNQKHRPAMIHRAPFGSLERFIGVLIEHTGGNFKTWLAPIQVQVIPVSQQFEEYAGQVAAKLSDYRVEVDLRNEKVGYKIRGAETQKVPYMAIVGEREQESGSVSVRRHGKGELGTMSVDSFKETLDSDISSAFRPVQRNV